MPIKRRLFSYRASHSEVAFPFLLARPSHEIFHGSCVQSSFSPPRQSEGHLDVYHVQLSLAEDDGHIPLSELGTP